MKFRKIGILTVVFVFVCMLFTTGCNIFNQTLPVVGDSMLPTLKNEDKISVTRNFLPLERGDIIAFNKKAKVDGPIIKRVIALPGEEIDIDFERGIVYVNGIAIDEPYIKEPTLMKKDVDFPQVVPEDCVFVLGDNRNASHDSRTVDVGFVSYESIIGKMVSKR